ncbi:hypothetical protein BCU39_000120 [Vibrio cyclitrophicus]|uniref:hypothetical protein n=1 Tax=Vibrio cyclitrophicus TaxID=47951 RepID=UPI000C83051A|nr:hypothetical protein [Vibrio cyclitrophicus]PMI67733.1 hypothetical protein BCU39_14860 [Vibrio cyclitrophicus]
MEAFAIWLVFLSLIPIVYWGVKVLITKVINLLFPHTVILEIENEDGSWDKTSVSASSNKEFFELTLKAAEVLKAKHRKNRFAE